MKGHIFLREGRETITGNWKPAAAVVVKRFPVSEAEGVVFPRSTEFCNVYFHAKYKCTRESSFNFAFREFLSLFSPFSLFSTPTPIPLIMLSGGATVMRLSAIVRVGCLGFKSRLGYNQISHSKPHCLLTSTG